MLLVFLRWKFRALFLRMIKMQTVLRLAVRFWNFRQCVRPEKGLLWERNNVFHESLMDVTGRIWQAHKTEQRDAVEWEKWWNEYWKIKSHVGKSQRLTTIGHVCRRVCSRHRIKPADMSAQPMSVLKDIFLVVWCTSIFHKSAEFINKRLHILCFVSTPSFLFVVFFCYIESYHSNDTKYRTWNYIDS